MQTKIFELSAGMKAKIFGFSNINTANLLESMGIHTGQYIKVIHKSSSVVFCVNFRTIAISKKLAEEIYVVL